MARPLDEEPLDRYLNRPAAKPVARMLLPLPVSPNQVSWMAAACGVLAGVALALDPRWAAVAAVGFGWGAMVLDCADGQLARARGGGSKYGYLVDGVADYIIATGTHLGFLAAVLSSPATGALPWPAIVAIVVACGVSMAVHSNVFESVKFRYRVALGDTPGAHLTKQREILESLERERGFVAWIGRILFRGYFNSQRRMSRQAEEEGPVSRRAFLLSLTLGPTLRLAILLGSACAAAWRPEAIWIYPAYALVAANLFYLCVRFEARQGA